MTEIVVTLRADLTAAMKRRDREAARVLRTTLSAIANAEAQPARDIVASPGDGPIAGATSGLGAAEVERRTLTADDVRRIVAAERDDRLDAATGLEAAGRDATALRAEAALLDSYLA